MKKWWKHSKRSVLRGILAASCAMFVFANLKVVCLANATGKVTAPSARIRQTADATSEVVGSALSGKTVTILSQTTDASGYVWYEVHVGPNDETGYIRSDLLEVDSSSGTIPTTQTATVSQVEAASQAPAASGAEVMPETGMDAQYATIKVGSAVVRSTASKNGGKVVSLPENTQVIVSGQTEGTDMTWYYVTFTDTNGAEKTGYVRSDLITLGDLVPVEAPAEEQPAEEQPETQEPESGGATVQSGYEAVYELDDATGTYVWKLYDWDKGEKQNLEDVLNAAHAQSRNDELDAATVTKQRIVIIVLIVVIIILAVAVTIMIFKLRDAYYEAYEDEEDEEEDEEEDRRSRRREERTSERAGKKEGSRRAREESPDEGRRKVREENAGESRRRVREEGAGEGRRRRDEDEEPVRRKSSASREERPAASARKRTADSDRRMPSREVSYEEDMEAPVKTAPKKKAKNFLVDDDDFEFEFLNMKNKDNDI